MKKELTVTSKLLEVNRQLMEAVKIQRSMLQDLIDYVNKRDRFLQDIVNKLDVIWEK